MGSRLEGRVSKLEGRMSPYLTLIDIIEAAQHKIEHGFYPEMEGELHPRLVGMLDEIDRRRRDHESSDTR